MDIVLLNGYVGCLKTTLSYLLAPSLGMAHISTSVLGPFTPRSNAPDFLSLRDKRYRVAAEIADSYLGRGVSIILDGTYALHRWRNKIYYLACKYSIEDVIAITCTCSRPGVLRERFEFRQRFAGVPDAQANEMEAYERSVLEFEPVQDDKLPNGKGISHIEFDSGTFEVTIHKCTSKLAETVAAVINNFIDFGVLRKPQFTVTASLLPNFKYPIGNRLWIAVEGIGGSGKTTQCRRLAAQLHSLLPSHQILVIDELSDTSLGQFLRANVPQDHEFRIQIKGLKAYYLESLLVIADKFQTVEALSKGDWDICIFDGLQWSLVAHAIAGLPRSIFEEVQGQVRKAIEILLDHLPYLPGKGVTFFLDIRPETALMRLETRVGSSLEREHLVFLQRLANAYSAIAQGNQDIFVVDASQPVDAVTEMILTILGSYLKV